MNKRVLLLGHTGKLGCALNRSFNRRYAVTGKNSQDFDASNFSQVCDLVREARPGLVINAVAFVGINQCEQNPQKALSVNTLFPRLLVMLSKELGFTLIHFSTEAVFPDAMEGKTFTEKSAVSPRNMYGVTKYGADCLIGSGAERYYIFRLPIMFGESAKKNQFVEKMLLRIEDGAKELKIASDIFSLPSYNKDIAEEALRIYESDMPCGLYHVANEGRASLFDLIVALVDCLELDVHVTPVLHTDLPLPELKNLRPLMTSEKISPLRPWREALKDYCNAISEK